MDREIGDIENDLGFVEGQIEDLEQQLVQLRDEKDKFQCELESVTTWKDEE